MNLLNVILEFYEGHSVALTAASVFISLLIAVVILLITVKNKIPWLAWLLFILVGIASALLAASPAFTDADGSGQKGTPTVVKTFIPSDSYKEKAAAVDDSKFFSRAFCWDISAVSIRKDARRCVMGSYTGPIFDPCFTYKDDLVVCLEPDHLTAEESDAGHVLRALETTGHPEGFPSRTPVGAEEAKNLHLPWMLKLDQVDEGGNNYLCSPLLTESTRYDSITYECFASHHHRTVSSVGKDEFIQGGMSLYLTSKHDISGDATSLDMSGAVWTVEFSGPESKSTQIVGVLEAWF